MFAKIRQKFESRFVNRMRERHVVYFRRTCSSRSYKFVRATFTCLPSWLIRYFTYAEDRQPLEAHAIIYIPATLARRLVSSPVRYSIIIDYVQLTGGS